MRSSVRAGSRSCRLLRRRKLLLGLLGGCLLWLVASKTFMAYLAGASPETAIRLGGSDPTALVNLAESQMSSERAPNADAIERARAWAIEALQRDPLNARALRVLGQIAIANSDNAAASKLMLAAIGRSLHERRAVAWLMQQSIAREDYAAAARCANVLMRTRPQLSHTLAPAMAAIAGHRGGKEEFAKLLTANPPWRTNFISEVLPRISDPKISLELLLSLKGAPWPPSKEELASFLGFLVANNQYELAYYAHLQFLPPERLSRLTPLYNGDFTSLPSGLPFDWTIFQGPGVTIDIVPRPNRQGDAAPNLSEQKRALVAELGPGRVEFRPVSQLVMLPPGRHRFSGEYTGDIRGVRGLVWRITCASTPDAPIGQTPMFVGSELSWKTFEFEFTVPAANCRAQYVTLLLDARSASEQLVAGEAWYANLAIERLSQPAPMAP